MTTKTLKYATLLATTLPVAAVANAGTEQTVDLPKTVVTGKQVEAPSSHDIELDPSLNSKLQVPLEDLARSVDIISSEKFTEKGAVNLQETLNYSAGVFPSVFGIDTRIDTSHVRGLDPEKFQDGFKAFEGFYNAPRVETFTLESVELIKGPASTLYGQGALGGIINANSKLPQEEARTELNMQIGSDNRFQTGLDSTGAMNDDGTLLYRLVALGRSSETEVDFVDDDAMVLMPSITWKPSEDTSLTLLANWQEHDTGSTIQFIPNEEALDLRPLPFGLNLPALNTLNIDPKTFVGNPEFDKYETKSESYSLMLDHQINDVFSISMNSRYWDSESDYQYLQPLGNAVTALIYSRTAGNPAALGLPTLTDPGDVYQLGFIANGELDILANHLVLKMNTEFFGIENKAQFGIDYIDIETGAERARDQVLAGLGQGELAGYFLTPNKINLVNPVFGGAPTAPTTFEYRDTTNEQTGVYFGNVMTIDQLIASFNVRYDHVKMSYERKGINPDGSDSTKWSDTEENLGGDASVMYQFENGISPYYSYAESFDPNDADPNGNLVDPREGSQHEIGLKFLSDDENTFVTAAVFKIKEDNNVQNTNPATFEVFDATYEGAELSIDHKMDDLYLQASYTYLDAKKDTESATPANRVKDADVQNVADQLVNGWVSYVPGGEGSNGFRAGAGARYVGNTVSDGGGNFETGGYTLFDAMLGYRINEFDFQFNVTNLTDKEHTVAIGESPLGSSSNTGQGRFANLTAKIVF